MTRATLSEVCSKRPDISSKGRKSSKPNFRSVFDLRNLKLNELPSRPLGLDRSNSSSQASQEETELTRKVENHRELSCTIQAYTVFARILKCTCWSQYFSSDCSMYSIPSTAHMLAHRCNSKFKHKAEPCVSMPDNTPDVLPPWGWCHNSFKRTLCLSVDHVMHCQWHQNAWILQGGLWCRLQDKTDLVSLLPHPALLCW